MFKLGNVVRTLCCIACLSFVSLYSMASGDALPAVVDLSDADVTIHGICSGDKSGCCVFGAGDVNGDGIEDFIIGAYLGDPGGDSQAGESYIVYGSTSDIGTSGALYLEELNGGNGVRLDGIDAWDYSGWNVAGTGDIDGDGYVDVLVGALGEILE